MIHLQRSVDNWTDAIRGTFPFCVKAVDQADLLRTAKQLNPNVFTVLRHHYDGMQVPSPLGTVEDNLHRARDFFATFIDGTFKAQYAPFVDAVESWNEYLADSQDAAELNRWLAWAEAAARVWRDEYRTQPEYAHIRLVLCNTAVGNMIDRRFAEIALQYDCLLGYHPYTLWEHSVRWEGDWENLSGLFEAMEAEWGGDLKPEWIFTECGPFQAAEDGWRSQECLGGDMIKYIIAMRQWVQNVKETDAFRTHRIRGCCVFTTGNDPRWTKFETGQPELSELMDMFEEEWQMPTETYIEGIDVSRWQGTIDWSKVAADGKTFACLRATVGDYYTDPQFETYYAGAKAAGLKVSAYHVVTPEKPAGAQIERFLTVLGDRALDFRPVLDVELERGQTVTTIDKRVRECIELLVTHFGCEPIIYTGAWFWNFKTLLGAGDNCPLWVAWYNTSEPPKVRDFATWTIWQYSSSGRVNGINGNVDLDRAKSLPGFPPPTPEPEPEPEPCAGCVELARQLAEAQAELADCQGVLAACQGALDACHNALEACHNALVNALGLLAQVHEMTEAT